MADLSNVKLFHGMPDGELKKIAKRMQEVNHPAGTEVMVQGRNGAGFMVILTGEAEVEIPGGRHRSLGPGDHFGEMALLDHQGRSASITAKSDLKVLAVPEWEFMTFLKEHPEVAIRMLQTLTRRLREVEAAQA